MWNGCKTEADTSGRSETSVKKYNPINLYAAAKLKPQEKEVKEELNQAEKLLEMMSLLFWVMSASITLATGRMTAVKQSWRRCLVPSSVFTAITRPARRRSWATTRPPTAAARFGCRTTIPISSSPSTVRFLTSSARSVSSSEVPTALTNTIVWRRGGTGSKMSSHPRISAGK